jgi:hypothetical protein
MTDLKEFVSSLTTSLARYEEGERKREKEKKRTKQKNDTN